jgi:carbon monoxide dehydrogenase subunit G
MKVQLEKSFPMPASPDRAWTLLQNIEAVAGCMPGAKITERIDDSNYKGTVTVRLGPATMSFKGDIQVLDVDVKAKTLRMVGKGSDSSGTSGATMDLTARIEPGDNGQSNLLGRSEVSISGKAATFGGRMMNTVSDQMLKQFAANFAQQVQVLQAQGGAGPAAGQAAKGPELNALALLWAIIKDWLRGLFGKKPA